MSVMRILLLLSVYYSSVVCSFGVVFVVLLLLLFCDVFLAVGIVYDASQAETERK